eukprot:CAMPEP_0115874822 /NCGR_PEP_ID=MMETSP0287-20121206/24752_1 /TAXON_ID=412157 /ORGANISM="Chrysochromulina rotalis, Strain UIO044" /LENGTH=112 /DNA_ID=CAMNT_0003330011 /DNA_START=391 /DNA_END=725 /DNA_ORIENTATION=+
MHSPAACGETRRRRDVSSGWLAMDVALRTDVWTRRWRSWKHEMCSASSSAACAESAASQSLRGCPIYCRRRLCCRDRALAMAVTTAEQEKQAKQHVQPDGGDGNLNPTGRAV